jgi:hypothetical protein
MLGSPFSANSPDFATGSPDQFEGLRCEPDETI